MRIKFLRSKYKRNKKELDPIFFIAFGDVIKTGLKLKFCSRYLNSWDSYETFEDESKFDNMIRTAFPSGWEEKETTIWEKIREICNLKRNVNEKE